MKKTILVFSGLILASLLLFQISKYSMLSGNLKMEIAVSLIAMTFFVIGIYINKKSIWNISKPSKEINHTKIKELEITSREYEVLQAISQGLSNKEIANRLFLSESTIKTHVSNVLLKLHAKRRTQAIKIAKDIKIL